MNGNIGNMGDMGSMIAKMLEDPEALGKVMSIAGTLSSSGILNGLSLGENSEKESSGEETANDSREENAVSTYQTQGQGQTNEGVPPKQSLPQSSPRRKVKSCDRIRLLEAMRPFLSDDKRDKLDVVIKIIGLADAAGGLYRGK